MTQCYHRNTDKERCTEAGTHGLRKGDPVYAHSPFLQRARYCKKHKHYDDVLIKEEQDGKDRYADRSDFEAKG